jgi:ElaB/YqjD/DUF883 family membrane-anchored ribosome-binding protein
LEGIIATVTGSATEADRDYAEAVIAAVQENVRDLRRAAVTGRHAAEDCAADATLQVRRRPFLSLGVAVGVGALFGCLIGFSVGRFRRRSFE